MKRLFTLCVLTFLVVGARAQQQDSLLRVYFKLANSSDDKDKAEFYSRIENDLKTEDESRWTRGWTALYRLGRKKQADSIMEAGLKKWPDGLLAKEERFRFVNEEREPVKKDSLYRLYYRRYPPDKDEQPTYDLMHLELAVAYLDKGYVSKSIGYADKIKDDYMQTSAALQLFNKDICKEPAAILTKTIDSTKDYRFASLVFFQNQEDKKAEKYVEKAYQADHDSPFLLDIYYQVLKRLGKDQREMEVLEEATRLGYAKPAMKKELRALYVKLKGTENGYDAYVDGLNREYMEHLNASLKKSLISEPAPDFTMKNLDGKEVKLSELKGKIVVLDFWATWCGPCVGSFPAMQDAMKRFEKDEDVKFLFVNTWEVGDDGDGKVRKFITDNKYPFEVVVDLPDYKVCGAYQVNGIPAKFVIDKEGNIRFRFSGYNGSDESTTEEVSAMVKMLK